MKKLRQGKYDFYRFCSFSPTEQQIQHFLRSLVLPVFIYNSVIWFNSCTQDERDVFVTFLSKLGVSSDNTLLVKNAIFLSVNRSTIQDWLVYTLFIGSSITKACQSV